MKSAKRQAIGFGHLPPLGTSIIIGGQRYELESWVGHTRTDGGESAVLTWSTACAECGERFEVTSGLSGIRELAKRCVGHRQPAQPALSETQNGG